MKKRTEIRKMTLTAFFIAIQIIMTITPIGYIPIGPINVTTMHIPVILAGILIGTKYGLIVGFVFGLTSLLKNTFMPGVTSFVFSPFITVGGMSGNFLSLIITFVPRMFLGWFSGKLFRLIRKKVGNLPACAISAGVNTMIHTLLVMGMIYVFFGPSYAQALGTDMSAVVAFIIGIITTNGVAETILAIIAIPLLDKALWPSIRKLKLEDTSTN